VGKKSEKMGLAWVELKKSEKKSEKMGLAMG